MRLNNSLVAYMKHFPSTLWRKFRHQAIQIVFPAGSCSIQILRSLLFYTILGHLLMWPLMEATSGELWVFGTRSFQQFQLFEPGLDGGYFEHFQYILLFWCALLSTFICLRTPPFGASMALLYWLLFLTDSFSLVDASMRATGPIFELLGLNAGVLRIKDFLEYTYWIPILIIFGCLYFWDLLRSSKRWQTAYLYQNINLLALLGFFSVFIDTVNANIVKWLNPYFSGIILKAISYSFYIFEEVGEITAISLIFIFLLGRSRKSQNHV